MMPKTSATLRRDDGVRLPILNTWMEALSETPGTRSVAVNAGHVLYRRPGLTIGEARALCDLIIGGGEFDERLHILRLKPR